MSATVFLITPPFTQLNTPYPATAYLKGFLNTRHISAFQADLGIEVTLALFSRQGLTQVFAALPQGMEISANARRILSLQQEYLNTIDAVISFLQDRNPMLAHRLVQKGFLPRASRFEQSDDLSWAFGSMGRHDMARHLATMYLEDLADFIKECIDPHFGFSRYAEKLGRSAASFDELYDALHAPHTLVDSLLAGILEKHLQVVQPAVAAVSVPFPGNLYCAFRCAQWIKQYHPEIKTAMGGGYANTELRSLNDPRVFDFFDFITLDDGEAPLERLVAHVQNNEPADTLKRTFIAAHGAVVYINNAMVRDYPQEQTGTPDYSDFLLDRYISAIEVVNPMHSLWSDGRWNKLTMAHGCYWGKCTFCDISLNYIKLYEPLTAALLCDRIEAIIAQTGQNGFHFVDEAAPPALMRALAIEILRRKLVVSWWTNIRFEKSFTRDLCLLLRASGCIAVSGGLEVASDRLLQLIQKGISVAQVARVNNHFTSAGIMVHAYLMYGFPTQTAQETIDALEMVRQMFGAGIMQSAFWHQFTMTAHSPVGLNPAQFGVQRKTEATGSFANNDLEHLDPGGANHPQFAYGLKKSLHNYMHGRCLNDPLQQWFDFKVPKTTVQPGYIAAALQEDELPVFRPHARVLWTGSGCSTDYFIQAKHGNQREMASMVFHTAADSHKISLPAAQARWLTIMLPALAAGNMEGCTLGQLRQSYESAGLEDFELFWHNKPMSNGYKFGLLCV